MQLDSSRPAFWTFTPEELAEVGKLLNTPLMAAFLQSLEADALVAQHEVELVQNISDAAMRVVAASAFAQGQIYLAQHLRKLHTIAAKIESTGDK